MKITPTLTPGPSPILPAVGGEGSQSVQRGRVFGEADVRQKRVLGRRRTCRLEPPIVRFPLPRPQGGWKRARVRAPYFCIVMFCVSLCVRVWSTQK